MGAVFPSDSVIKILFFEKGEIDSLELLLPERLVGSDVEFTNTGLHYDRIDRWCIDLDFDGRKNISEWYKGTPNDDGSSCIKLGDE